MPKVDQAFPDLEPEMQIWIGECYLIRIPLADIVELFTKRFPNFGSDLPKEQFLPSLRSRIRKNSATYKNRARQDRLDNIPAEDIDEHLRRAETLWLSIDKDMTLNKYEKNSRLQARNLQLSILKYMSGHIKKHNIGIPGEEGTSPPDEDPLIDPDDELTDEEAKMQDVSPIFGSLSQSSLQDDDDAEKV